MDGYYLNHKTIFASVPVQLKPFSSLYLSFGQSEERNEIELLRLHYQSQWKTNELSLTMELSVFFMQWQVTETKPITLPYRLHSWYKSFLSQTLSHFPKYYLLRVFSFQLGFSHTHVDIDPVKFEFIFFKFMLVNNKRVTSWLDFLI